MPDSYYSRWGLNRRCLLATGQTGERPGPPVPDSVAITDTFCPFTAMDSRGANG